MNIGSSSGVIPNNLTMPSTKSSTGTLDAMFSMFEKMNASAPKSAISEFLDIKPFIAMAQNPELTKTSSKATGQNATMDLAQLKTLIDSLGLGNDEAVQKALGSINKNSAEKTNAKPAPAAKKETPPPATEKQPVVTAQQLAEDAKLDLTGLISEETLQSILGGLSQGVFDISAYLPMGHSTTEYTGMQSMSVEQLTASIKANSASSQQAAKDNELGAMILGKFDSLFGNNSTSNPLLGGLGYVSGLESLDLFSFLRQ